MRIASLTINFTDIEDALTLGQSYIVTEILSHALEIVKSGGRIIIQEEYINAPPRVIKILSSTDDVQNLKNQLNESQVILGRDKID